MAQNLPLNRKLTGAEKASILVLSLKPELVSTIFEKLEPFEIRDLTRHMSNLGRIDSETVEDLYVTFAENVTSAGSLSGNIDTTERLLRGVLDETETKRLIEEIRGPAGRTVWEKMANVNEEILAFYLQGEVPQLVAVVMTKLEPDYAARVLKLLPRKFAEDIILRMLTLEPLQPEIISDIECTLRNEFMSNVVKTGQGDAYERLANIFNALDRTSENEFFDALDKASPEDAEKVRELMFTFDDISRFDSKAIQTILSGIDRSKLPLALKGASEEMLSIFLDNMSVRAAKLMREDIESLGKVRLREVEDAQSTIVFYVKELLESGAIEMLSSDVEDEYI